MTTAREAELSALNVKLELAARQWRATADAIDDGLLLIDANDKIVRMNRAAAAALEGSWSVWVGQSSDRLAKYPPWNDAVDLGRQALARNTIVTGRAHNAASGRTWELWARPLPDPVDSTVLLIARDVTAFLALQDSVLRAETMAALGALTAGFAHEVRNPLFAISSLVEAWAQQPRRDPAPFADALHREVARLQTMMVELLEFGKPSTEVFEPRRLSAAVHGAVRACQLEAKARAVHLVTSVVADAEVAMIRTRLERVFVNLIQNAIQHSPAGSKVAIEVGMAPGSRDQALEITVRDQGPGISTDDLPKLFTPFFSRRAGGFGLGLAMSQRIVDEHHGRVTASNGAAGGAVMTVIVPVSARQDDHGPAEDLESAC
jgi:signal transduction histidine kinase